MTVRKGTFVMHIPENDALSDYNINLHEVHAVTVLQN